MATTKLAGNPVQLAGEFPGKGTAAKNFVAVKQDLSEFSLEEFQGKRKILNVFPSIDTDVCATSVRTFNKKASPEFDLKFRFSKPDIQLKYKNDINPF